MSVLKTSTCATVRRCNDATLLWCYGATVLGLIIRQRHKSFGRVHGMLIEFEKNKKTISKAGTVDANIVNLFSRIEMSVSCLS